MKIAIIDWGSVGARSWHKGAGLSAKGEWACQRFLPIYDDF